MQPARLRQRVSPKYRTHPKAEQYEPEIPRGELRLVGEWWEALTNGEEPPPEVRQRVRSILVQMAR